MRRLRPWLVGAIAITLFFALAPGRVPGDPERPITVQRPAVDFFPIGWYSALDQYPALSEIASDGANTVMPYFIASANTKAYLRTAAREGVKVLLEIDRTIVRNGSTADLVRFVKRYRDDPALLGWYLADEPSSTVWLGALSDERATKLYRTIKRVDPDHPVAIAFNTSEDARAFTSAMDILMLDEYPFRPSTPEFASLPAWWKRLTTRALLGRAVGGFVPVLQAFGGRGSPRNYERRFPTGAEMRYMAFASLEAGATGIFLWTRYRSDQSWIDAVLVPILRELRELDPVLRAGTLETTTSVDRRDVGLTMFRGPNGDHYLLVVHHGDGDVRPVIALEPSLHGSDVTRTDHLPLEVSGEEVVTTLGPFGVQVLRIRPPTR